MIRTLITFCCVFMIGLTFTPEVAEAKRFGGGSSFGKMFSTPKKVAPAPKAAPQPTAAKTTAAGAATRGGLGTGMLGGLLAGGMLGALFFGGAFEGLQMMDVLIMALIAFIAFKLFTRGKTAARPQYAGHPSSQAEPTSEPLMRQPQTFNSSATTSWGLASEESLELPGWFNKDAFLEGARGHFGQLQLAWNQNDLEEIRSYCSAELFAALEEERKRLGEGALDNDLVSVIPELVGFAENQGEAQLSVHFNGWMREGRGEETTEFNEIWHLTKTLEQADADWFIVGIEQPR
mgnify:FL=1